MATSFPVSFFTKIFSVKKIFKSRNKFNWFQLIFIFVFINSLFLIPLSQNFLENKNLLLSQEMSEALDSIDQETADSIKSLQVEDQTLVSNEQSYMLEDKSQNLWTLHFSKNHWGVTPNGKSKEETIIVPYQEDTFENFERNGVVNVLKNSLLKNNLSSFFFTAILNITIALTTMNLVLIIGVSIFLYFTKITSSIKTFKEAFTISLLSVSLGAIVATIVGLFVPNIILMYGIESIGLILTSLVLFYKTQYKE